MTESHECKNCENFDLSTNMCLQHNEMGYDCDEHCLHIGCEDWIQRFEFVPDMREQYDVEYLRYKADRFDEIVDIVNNTDSQWDSDVKSAYMEIEKIVKGNSK